MIDIDLGSLAVYSAEPGTRREPTVTGAASLWPGRQKPDYRKFFQEGERRTVSDRIVDRRAETIPKPPRSCAPVFFAWGVV